MTDLSEMAAAKWQTGAALVSDAALAATSSIMTYGHFSGIFDASGPFIRITAALATPSILILIWVRICSAYQAMKYSKGQIKRLQSLKSGEET